MMIFRVISNAEARVVVAPDMAAAVAHVGGRIDAIELLHGSAEVATAEKPKAGPEATAQEFISFSGLKPSVIQARSRGTRRVADARAALFYLMRQEGLSMADIGQRFGRDHTTVVHATQRAEAELEAGEGGVYKILQEFERARA